MLMNQRSSDYEVSCAINELQYIALQLMVAKVCGFKPGMFTHVIENVQIYDRHVNNVKKPALQGNLSDAIHSLYLILIRQTFTSLLLMTLC